MEEVARNRTTRSLWVVVKGKVYNVSQFIFDHPGGEEIMLQHAGRDITSIMGDPTEHVHSESAYEILEEYYIGDLVDNNEDNKSSTTTKSGKQQQQSETTVLSTPSEKFIDVRKPMLWQVWTGGYSKEFYLKQVHIPHHTKDSAPIFGHPYLEVFTKTAWWVVPLVWVPFAMGLLLKALEGLPGSVVMPLFVAGWLNWSVIEYCVHRYLFHVDALLPDNRVAITVHFLIHGVHHFLPMDRMRLVMPPVLFAVLSYPVYSLYGLFLPPNVTYAVAAGSYIGYVMYDLMHYYIHHGRPWGAYLREMKTYHLDHHYKNENLGFGITSKLWDHMFGT
ncbi:fatty acid alpha-hydroxylase, partial [Quaeritorhiza haematococci]